MTHYFFIDDMTTAGGILRVENLGTDMAEAIKKADRFAGYITEDEMKRADLVQFWACEMTDEEIAAVEEGETEKWYGDYCKEIITDYKEPKKWYAIQKESQDPLDIGSFDYDEAVRMAKENGYHIIATCINGDNVIEEEEI